MVRQSLAASVVTTAFGFLCGLALALLASSKWAYSQTRFPPTAAQINIPLADASGNVKLFLTYRARSGAPDITLSDVNHNPLYVFDTQRQSLPALPQASESDEKADAATPQDVAFLQGQIDEVRRKLNLAVQRLNSLTQ
jgi:hypothetical protein